MNDFKPLNKLIEEHIEYEGKNRRLESSNKLLKEMILKVKKEGKHDDLIRIKDGVYKYLYEYQVGLH